MDRLPMQELEVQRVHGHETIVQDVIHLLEEMTKDWETGFSGKIGPETYLVADLGCESIDMVALILAIEEHYKRRDWPFEELLMVDGRYVDDLRIDAIAHFLHKHGAGR
jgi:acyl carrier protein